MFLVCIVGFCFNGLFCNIIVLEKKKNTVGFSLFRLEGTGRVATVKEVFSHGMDRRGRICKVVNERNYSKYSKPVNILSDIYYFDVLSMPMCKVKDNRRHSAIFCKK